MNIDYNQIEFILGNSKGVAVFSSEHLISCSNLSLSKLKDDIVKHGSHFIQISNEAWINTKFVVARLPQRMIKLKSGSILKVGAY